MKFDDALTAQIPFQNFIHSSCGVSTELNFFFTSLTLIEMIYKSSNTKIRCDSGVELAGKEALTTKGK
jgi:hypothetical protein